MRKRWITASAAAVATSVLVLSMAGTAQAATDGVTGKGGRGGGLGALVVAGTITKAQAVKVHDAMHAAKASGVDRAAAAQQALAALVADGTLTQAQADAIIAARAAHKAERSSSPQSASS